MAMRTITMLPCITGSWKEVGGGLQLSTSGGWGLKRETLDKPELMQQRLGRPARVVNMVELGKALNTLKDPPIQALYVYNSNPAAVCPNHNDVILGLKRQDLFAVVHEQFFTDTTDYANIVLPATTFFEHKDLQTAYGHYYIQMSNQAIEPLGECRSNVEVFRGLARAMEFEDECFSESVDEMIDTALSSANPWLWGIDRERLEKEGHARLNFESRKSGTDGQDSRPFLPFAEGGFQTPSRKAEFYNPALIAQGLDPVAEFVPPKESRHAGEGFPLELLARKADNYLNSTFSNLPAMQEMEDTSLLEIHAKDADARGIRDGDPVRVFNARGDLTLRAHVNGAVQPGVVAAKLNWAKLTPGGSNINTLTSEKLTDMGNSATFYSVLVEVELAKPTR
jgi:anaerobic selenocysteine-containing dehydrogenase